ncbi:hypothetical protein GCG54_00015247 [Colletotrichum gloeosporioides]|uniref:Uncharacterized protein n=1 Tax=Colletotrichum gloeosporioides TaxID=474922 RepID=A0A8H4FDQ0_COLGL|nr:uncharacterized protein GCG54_00015247 [Colletotrichum gloeosporioides]KAF3798543.1 hypothetical protein GCG54_00015247 [Colletotrichum gloeosporioides]
MEPMSQTTPADVAPPTDASPANAANWQPQGEAHIELQSLAQPQARAVQPTSPPTTSLDPQSPQPQAQTNAAAQHPPALPIDEREILIPIPAPTTQGEAEAGVRRKIPQSGFPTAAEIDESVAWFTKYLVMVIAVAGAQGTPALPAIILKASSRFYLS